MKRNNIVIYSFVFFVIVLFTVDTVTMALLGQHLHEIFIPQKSEASVATQSSAMQCTDKPKIVDLAKATAPELKKLGLAQDVCNSYVSNEVMIFTNMPKDERVAKENAAKMATILKEFSRYNVKPLVIAEPETAWGLVDFVEFKNGFYDAWLNVYFAELKRLGITEKQMGTWVPFPEANLPYWNHANTQPKDFAILVNRYFAVLKKHFPKAEGSVLLNSATYATDDFDWRNGEYLSLIPYVSGINKEYVQSFGLQGFPWTPPATDYGVNISDAGEFINHHLAIAAAKELGVKKIWYNTGTFGRKYTNDPKSLALISAGERLNILRSIINEALITKKSGYAVSVNLFSEDKSKTTEATDWSYFKKPQDTNAKDALVFGNFMDQMTKNGIPVSYFDK